MIDVILSSIVQGATEFIPVSSSLHLLILNSLLYNQDLSLLLITGMHMGSVFALFLFFYLDSKIRVSSFFNINFLKLILIGTVPIFIFGFLLFNFIEGIKQVTYLIIFTTFFFGLLLYISDLYSDNKRTLNELSIRDLLIIGFSQCLSLIPGTSRSASVIISSRIMKIDRESSILLSLLLSIPVISGAFFLSLYKINTTNSFSDEALLGTLLSVAFSFFSSYLALKFFYFHSKSYGFKIFAFYRFFLAIILYFVYF